MTRNTELCRITGSPEAPEVNHNAKWVTTVDFCGKLPGYAEDKASTKLIHKSTRWKGQKAPRPLDLKLSKSFRKVGEKKTHAPLIESDQG